MRAALLAVTLLLSGCIGADLKESVIALSQSDRSWCASVSTIYGTVKIGGSGLNQGKMVCNGEGWAMDSQNLNQGGGNAIVIPAQPRIFMQEPAGIQEVDPSIFRRLK